MEMIRRVLFPVDFSLGCQELASTIRRMVEVWRAEVTLLHVIEDRQWLGRRHELGRLLAQMKAIAGNGPQAGYCGCRVERGAPGERILQYVQDHPIDLVVISAGGSPILRRRPIGSVADEVLAEAPCPVWLDWGAARSPVTSGMYARRVGCALGLGVSDEAILGEAVKLAAELQAELSVIHAIPPMAAKPLIHLWDPRARERELEEARRRLDGLRCRFAPSAEVIIEVGPNQMVVSRALQRRETGLLVTGNCREAILAAESECPVLRLATPASAVLSAAEPQRPYTAMQRSA